MGKKGMKGFLKGSHKHAEPEHDDDEPPPAELVAAAPVVRTVSASNQPPKVNDDHGENDGNEDDEAAGGPETRPKLLQRQKKEMLAHKKAVQRMGKKSKDELAKLHLEIEQRHAEELRNFDQRQHQQQQFTGPRAMVAASAGTRVDGGADKEDGLVERQTKAQKRRQKLVQLEADREAHNALEKASLGPSASALEAEQLAKLLNKLGLRLREVRADGHCLFRALEDQLVQLSEQSKPNDSSNSSNTVDKSYLGLRQGAATYIRSHPHNFLPFLDDEDSQHEGLEPEARLEAYCDRLEHTAMWGGQLELEALAQVLQRPIRVHTIGLPTVCLGHEFEAGCTADRVAPLQLCYLRHAYGLGEHYNSVEPLLEREKEGVVGQVGETSSVAMVAELGHEQLNTATA